MQTSSVVISLTEVILPPGLVESLLKANSSGCVESAQKHTASNNSASSANRSTLRTVQ